MCVCVCGGVINIYIRPVGVDFNKRLSSGGRELEAFVCKKIAHMQVYALCSFHAIFFVLARTNISLVKTHFDCQSATVRALLLKPGRNVLSPS